MLLKIKFCVDKFRAIKHNIRMEFFYKREDKTTNYRWFKNSYLIDYVKNSTLTKKQKEDLKKYVNLAIHILKKRQISPNNTFKIIDKFAKHIDKYRGENFTYRLSEYDYKNDSKIYVIEPPCGSNTTIIKSQNDYIFIDTGYAIYKREMIEIIDKITGGFDKIYKRALLTHADVDHAGLLNDFDEVLLSDKSRKNYLLESENKRDFREINPLQLPYVKICKILTNYKPLSVEKAKVIAKSDDGKLEPLYKVSELRFGDFNFDIYYGQGGHLPGEIVLIDYGNKVVFSGDIFVNLKGYTKEQEKYNKCAPLLLNSVDTNQELCKIERNYLLSLLNGGNWRVFSGHGKAKEISV